MDKRIDKKLNSAQDEEFLEAEDYYWRRMRYRADAVEYALQRLGCQESPAHKEVLTELLENYGTIYEEENDVNRNKGS